MLNGHWLIDYIKTQTTDVQGDGQPYAGAFSVIVKLQSSFVSSSNSSCCHISNWCLVPGNLINPIRCPPSSPPSTRTRTLANYVISPIIPRCSTQRQRRVKIIMDYRSWRGRCGCVDGSIWKCTSAHSLASGHTAAPLISQPFDWDGNYQQI